MRTSDFFFRLLFALVIGCTAEASESADTTEIREYEIIRADTGASGIVRFQSGERVGGATIDLFHATSQGQRGVYARSTRSGTDGTYTFDLSPGCFVLTFIAPVGESFVRNGSQWLEVPFCIEEGQHARNLDGILRGGQPTEIVIRGRTLDANDGPVAGLHIDLFDALDDGSSRGEWKASVSSASSGEFSMTLNEAGCYVLVFVAPQGRTFVDGDGFLQRPFCIEPGGRLDGLDAVLADVPSEPFVAGTLRFEDGSAVSGGVVDLFTRGSEGRGTYLTSTESDESGRYRFSELEAQCYVLTFIAPPGSLQVNGTRWLEQEVCVMDGVGVDGLDVVVQRNDAPDDEAGIHGEVYFVDGARGDDGASGTSPLNAWRTFANVGRLESGDGLLLRRGTRFTTTLNVDVSGVVFGAYGDDGDAPLIDGEDERTSCVVVRGSGNEFRGLDVAACAWSGFEVLGDETNIHDCIVRDNVAGFVVTPSAERTRIADNEIVNNNRMSVDTPGAPGTREADDDSGAFGILLQGDHSVVMRNYIAGSNAHSYDYGRDGAAIEIYGASHSLVLGNTSIENHVFSETGKAQSDDYCGDNVFAFNVVYSTLEGSVFFNTRGAASHFGPVYDSVLINNTAVLTGVDTDGVVCGGGCSTSILRMTNNIVRARRKAGWADGSFENTHNFLLSDTIQFVVGSGSIQRGYDDDAGFVDETGLDFRLRADSPARDAGTAAPLSELRDEVDPPSGAPDIGAFEYR